MLISAFRIAATDLNYPLLPGTAVGLFTHQCQAAFDTRLIMG